MENNFWVVIPAAGTGQRFGYDLPKQYIKINNKTILAHTIERFTQHAAIAKIIVPIATSDAIFASMSIPPKVVAIGGGKTRMASVMNALHYLQKVAQPQDWVLVHDAVRFCLHPADLEHLIESLKEHAVGGLLCSKVTDTLKFAQDNKVLHTVDRAPLWQALTPQMFRLEILTNAFSHCIANEINITDECSAIEQLGLSAAIVEAKYPNPKLTYAKDLALLAALLPKINSIEELT